MKLSHTIELCEGCGEQFETYQEYKDHAKLCFGHLEELYGFKKESKEAKDYFGKLEK